VETLSRVKSEQKVKIAEEDKSDDFSRTEPHISLEKPLDIRGPRGEYVFTEQFKNYPFINDSTGIFQSEVRQRLRRHRRDGSPTLRTDMRLQIAGNVKADDGMEMRSFEASDSEPISRRKPQLKDIKAMIANLEKLRTAPLVDPYTGPAILSGKASGVFFHEILGHRLEGHRLKSESEGQTFKKKVDEKVLPEFISIAFDPTIRQLHGFALSGAFNFDDEGVKGEKVVSIQNGILKDFLMSRNPVERFPKSNGHGRSQPGMRPVSRQSNLIVDSKNMLSEEKLRRCSLKSAKTEQALV
jgi:hypothetical protein